MPLQKQWRTFFIVWFGQLVSLMGSGLTGFALGLWIYEQNRSVSQFALVALCNVLPRVLLSPLAGSLADRWNRRYVMMLSDTGAGLSTLFLVLIALSGQLTLWHVYLSVSLSSAFGAFQWPAYTAAITLLVPPEQYGRASGITQVASGLTEILTPVIAAGLLTLIGLPGILALDFITFLFAMATLLIVRFPMQTRSEALRFSVHTWWHDFMLGYRYIMARSGMRALMLFSAVVSFLWGMVGALIIPMLLGFASTGQLGVLLSIAGSGMLAGSIAMSVWGGPRRRVMGMFGFEAVSGLCFVAVGVSTQLAFVAASVFVAHFTIAVVNGSSQALWQAKVPIHIQGRVFAVLQALTRSSAPLAFLLAGFLADNVFLPLLAPGGILVDVIGPLIGVGPGRGIGFMFLLMGIIKMVVVTIGCLYAPIRHLERSVPDVPPAEPVRVHP